MANPVVIDFLVRGMPDVQRALKTTEQAVSAAEKSQVRLAQQAAKQKERIANQEARLKIQAMMKADRWHKQALDKAERETARAAAEKVRIEDRANQKAIRDREARAKAVERIQEREFRDLQRSIAREERAKDAAAKRWVRQREREQRIAEHEAIKDRRRFVGAIGGAIAGGVHAGATKVVGKAMQTAGMVGQLGGGFGIAESVQRTVALRGKLADIASRDTGTDPKNPKARRSTASLEGVVRGATTEFGIEADKGADALDKFASKTGELQKGLDMLRGLSELSRAGAGDLDDLADAAGDIFNADKTQSAEQVLQKLRMFAVQGQKGAVEMKDLASQMAKIGAAAGRFEGGAERNLLTFGALAQGARESGGAASATQATTAVASLSNQFYKNARLGKMAALGVDVKTKEGYNRPIDEILIELMQGAEKKSRAKGGGLKDFDMFMGTAIADAQARRATAPLEAAFKGAGGGEAGIKAVKEYLGKFGAGDRDLKAEFSDKAQARLQEDDVRMAKVRENFDRMVGDKLLPALMKLIPEFERMVPLIVDLNAKAIPAFVDFIKSVADFAEKNKGIISDIAAHPIGTIMAVEVTKSLATAGIGEMVKNLLARMITSAGGTVPSVPAGGGAVGGGAGAVAGAATLGMVAAGSYAQYKTITGAYDLGADASAEGKARAKVLADMAKDNPQAAAAGVNAAQADLDKGGGVAGARLTQATRALDYLNPASMVGQFAGDYLTKKITGKERSDVADAKRALSAKEIVDSEEIKKAIADAVREGAKNGSQQAPTSGAAPVPNAARGQSITERN